MKALSIAIAVCASIAASVCTGAPAETKVSANGITELKATIGGHAVEVRVWTQKFDIGKSANPPSISRNSCTHSRTPCSLVEAMQVSSDGKPIFVPRSVFADLSDLSDLRVSEIDRGFAISADGGDASEAYSVVINVETGEIVKRILSGYHDTDHPLQVTTYFSVEVE